MSDIIHLLPDSVANQIAAGEVIQRPASVVKELVENAIDAGATEIQIYIKDAGRTLIQVVDNGKGMSETDARLSFERHATSKINSAQDLYALRTMGFRGEALASIAAIAQVELRTRRPDDEIGTAILIAGSKVESQEYVSCAAGSNFMVKNIFFNVPARRKFLKSNQVEFGLILSEFERMALINTQIAFKLVHNDVELFHLPAANFRQRIVALFGKNLNQHLLSVDVQTSLVSITGYIGHPEAARKRNAWQYFFVNGRYMRHPYFHKAVMTNYEQLLPAGEMPHYFLHLQVDPSTIDVNIHPTKTEIKFENEQPIWQILSAAVKETLGKFNAAPSINFDAEGAPEIPILHTGQEVVPPRVSYSPDYNPFSTPSRPASASRRIDYDWTQLYENFQSGKDKDEPAMPDTESEIKIPSKINRQMSVADIPPTEASTDAIPLSIPMQEPSRSIDTGWEHLQIKGRYVLTSVKSGLMIIDQHRAHVRILFDKYMSYLQDKKGVSQRLIFPEMIQLSPAQGAGLASVQDDFEALGFDISDMGGGSFAVNAVPAGIDGLDVPTLVDKMLETATQKGGDVSVDVHEAISLALAESAAIPYGQILSPLEMEKLISDLFSLAAPHYTPDGKTVVSVVSDDELQKRFR